MHDMVYINIIFKNYNLERTTDSSYTLLMTSFLAGTEELKGAL